MPTFDADDQYSEALREAYASAPTDVVLLHTLEVRHPNFVDDNGDPTALRVVRDSYKISAGLEADAPMNPGETVEFQALYFDITLPGQNDGQASGEIEITIANVGREMMQYLDQAVESLVPIEITYRPYLSTDLTGPHMDPPITLTVRSTTASTESVVIRASYGDNSNRKFPSAFYTVTAYPGLAAK